MKKLMSLVLALMLILSCSAAFAEGEKVTIQFWHSMSGTNADSIDHMVSTFNASQDEIEVVATFQGDYWTSIANAIMAIATGTGPDVIQTGSGEARSLTDSEGVAANMLDFMSEEEGVWYEDFYEGFIKCYREERDGVDYVGALPMGCSTPVMYCNMDLLEKAGLEIPTTWEEMEAACATLVDGGYCDHGFAWGRDAWYLFMMIPNYSGMDLYAEDGLSLACREGGIAAYEFLQGLIEKNYFYPGPATDGGTIINQMMVAQNCAFYINSIGGLKTQETNAEEGGYTMQVASVPGGVVNSVPSGGNSLVILESGNKDAAWEFVKWMFTSNDGIAYFDYYSGYVACTNTLKNTEILQQKIAENENYARAYGFLENVNNNHLITGSSQSSTTYLRFLDAVFYDLEDVTEQWDLLEEEMKQVLADANDR